MTQDRQGAVRKWYHSPKIFLVYISVTIIFLLSCGCDNFTEKQKHIQKPTWASKIVILLASKNANYTTLPTWLVNTCVPVCQKWLCAYIWKIALISEG